MYSQYNTEIKTKFYIHKYIYADGFAPKPEKLKVNIEKSPFDWGFAEVSPKFVFQLVYSPMVFNYFLL